jgi:lysophospholipase L1-like esterase
MKIPAPKLRLLALFASAHLAGLPVISQGATEPPVRRFAFGPGPTAPGVARVDGAMLYSRELGYGFEPGAQVQLVTQESADPLRAAYATSGQLFRFSVALPPGNYRVTVTLGAAKSAATTTVKVETRRLALERIHTEAGQFETRSFLVNIRTPEMSPGNVLKLDTREINPQTHEAVNATWDDKLTLQFSDENPAVCAIELERVENAITVFLIGDSTVTDQPSEPYGTWGQMLPRWFKPSVAIADHAESGETVKAFRMQNRWLKVMSEMKPGDYVFMQFGHNDLNKTGHDGIWPKEDTMGDWVNTYSEANSDYKWLLASYCVEVRRRGGIPVIVSPMTKINLRTGELNVAGLGDYPKAAVEAAQLGGAACIDLNAMSIDVANGLGVADAPKAYVDGLHTNSYGGYLLSRCIVEGIRQARLGLADHLVDDAGSFDPKHPLPRPEDFKLPLEPRPPRPAGRGGPAAAGKAPPATK